MIVYGLDEYGIDWYSYSMVFQCVSDSFSMFHHVSVHVDLYET